jgi:hypothetical protein
MPRATPTSCAASPALAPLLAASRARRDSVVIVVDLPALAAEAVGRVVTGDVPLLISFGYADHRAHVRFAAPAATIAAALAAGS